MSTAPFTSAGALRRGCTFTTASESILSKPLAATIEGQTSNTEDNLLAAISFKSFNERQKNVVFKRSVPFEFFRQFVNPGKHLYGFPVRSG